MKTRDIQVGSKHATGFEIDLPGAPLLVAKADKGFVMCGYLNLVVAEKFGQAAAVVRGVKNLDELLEKPVAEASPAAQKRGVKPGMTGLQALRKLA